ncbi:FIG00733114: hypothetical protein [Cronobacter sakazakii 696]|nr:FIG00733114: hypothetical protein [Cronobacter sakazakii 696]
MVQPGAGLDERAARFRHFRAVDRHVAVDKQVGRFTETAAFEHCRPEQAVEVNDIFTDEVIQLGVRIFFPVLVKAHGIAALVAQVFERAHVADRRIQPDVKIFARRVRDFKTEVGRVAGDIPLLQAGFKPLLHFVRHLLLERAGAGPRLQHFAERRQIEEEVFRITHHRRGAGNDRFRLDKLRRAVSRAADFAVIAVLIRGFTFRAGAFYKTVRQEHAFFRVVELRNGTVFNKAVLFQASINQLRQHAVFVAVRRVIVVIADVKARKIGLMLFAHLGNHLLRRNAKLLGLEHDRRAVGVVGADEINLVAAHSLVTDPDISLDVLQHMAEVDGAVGVRQRARYQNFFRDLSHSEYYVFCGKWGSHSTRIHPR